MLTGIAGQVGPACAAVLGEVYAVFVRFNAGVRHTVQGVPSGSVTHTPRAAAVLGDSVPSR